MDITSDDQALTAESLRSEDQREDQAKFERYLLAEQTRRAETRRRLERQARTPRQPRTPRTRIRG